MKKLFLYLTVLAVSTFSFISCEKDKDDSTKVKDYLTLDEQQQLISNGIVRTLGAFDFSDYKSSVKDLIADILKDSIDWKASFKVAQNDSVYKAGIEKAMDKIVNHDFNFDSIYFDAFMSVRDTMIDDVNYHLALVDSTKDSTDSYNIFIRTCDGHVVSLHAKFALDDERIIKSVDYDTTSFLSPELIELSVKVDDYVIVELDGTLKTDFLVNINSTKSLVSGIDSLLSVKIKGSNLLLNGDLKFGDAVLSGKVGYTDAEGVSLANKISRDGVEILSFGANVKMPLDEGIDYAHIDSQTGMLMANKVEALGVNASLGGDQIKINAEFTQSPIIDLSAVAFATSDQMERCVNKLNEIFDGNIYFKGYSKPQAKIKFMYDESIRDTSDYQNADMMKLMLHKITHSGLYVAVEDLESKTISFNDYVDEVFLKLLHYFMVEADKPVHFLDFIFKADQFVKDHKGDIRKIIPLG